MRYIYFSWWWCSIGSVVKRGDIDYILWVNEIGKNLSETIGSFRSGIDAGALCWQLLQDIDSSREGAT